MEPENIADEISPDIRVNNGLKSPEEKEKEEAERKKAWRDAYDATQNRIDLFDAWRKKYTQISDINMRIAGLIKSGVDESEIIKLKKEIEMLKIEAAKRLAVAEESSSIEKKAWALAREKQGLPALGDDGFPIRSV